MSDMYFSEYLAADERGETFFGTYAGYDHPGWFVRRRR